MFVSTRGIMKVALRLLFLTLISAAVAQGACVQEDNCKRPDCVCGSTKSPFDPLPISITPQFVVVSFNDAITVTNYEFYLNLLSSYSNPNGCRMTMTMFLNHPNNDYAYANELWRLGAEIGVRSVTTEKIDYWKNADYEVWFNEISDARKMISKYAFIDEKDITGTRAPYMEIGGDDMYSALHDAGFTYDSSWTALDYTNWYGGNPLGALYPYTLDFKSPQVPDDCPLGRCPDAKYPGMFVTPVLDLQSVSGEPCNMIESCQSRNNETECPEQECEDRVFQFLKDNFNYNYEGNRAPFGLHTSHSWFLGDEQMDSSAHHNGYKRFLAYVEALEDVWIVSHDRMLEWIKNPVAAPDVGALDAFQCPTYDPPSTCPEPKTCTYDNVPSLGRMVMRQCSPICPDNYPWLGNVDGN